MDDLDELGVVTYDEDGEPLPLDILAIHRKRGIAILTNLAVVPITNWFSSGGLDTTEEHASICVAGAEGLGWYIIDLDNFEPVTVH